MDDADLANLMARAEAGDQAAVSDLLSRYEGELRMVVRSRLPRAMRSQFDSMDFVQVVWQDLFAKHGVDLSRFESERHFLAFLSGVAKNKVNEEHRRRTTQKFNVARQEPLYVRKGDREVPLPLAGHDPTPSQDAQAGDRLAQILKGRSLLEREVVGLRRAGLTYEEIAERLGIHEGRVRRMVEAIRDHMEDHP